MEQNKVEVLDEVQTDLESGAPSRELSGSEKLLMAERDRKDYVKAVNLVKIGCFKQVEEKTVDFSKLETVGSKTFKGLYKLYRNVQTMELVFVCPLVENNKDDENERKDLAPYAYDVIYLDHLDKETYDQVCLAARHNVKGLVTVFFIVTTVFVGLFVLNFFITFISYFSLITTGTVWDAFISTLISQSNPFPCWYVGFAVISILYTFLVMKYKKYMEN